MKVLDKIKAFFKWHGKEIGVSEPEAKGAEKKATEPPETKVEKLLKRKGDESSSK